MKTRILVTLLLLWALPGLVQPAFALTADEIRGGWVADVNGQRHIYILNVRGTDIKGIYCWDCSNPNNLAFVQGGKLESDGISFTVFHNGGTGTPYKDSVRGKLVNGQLVLTFTRQGATNGTANARPVEMTMQRDPRKPVSAPVAAATAANATAVAPLPPAGAGGAAGAGARGRGYVAPGPNEPVTVEKISGVWVGGGNGPNKQYFIFRQVEGQILGMVCGPCDNPFTFGVLNNGMIAGDTFTFNIVHEDWGAGIEKGPFNNMASVTIAKNEFRLRTQQENAPSGVLALEMILTGPLRLDPATGR